MDLNACCPVDSSPASEHWEPSATLSVGTPLDEVEDDQIGQGGGASSQ